MSMMKRISMIFRAKANKALDAAEDPRETLDYSYQRQVEMLTKVRARRRRRGHQPQARRAADQPAQDPVRQAHRAGAEGALDGARGPGARGADPQVRRSPGRSATSQAQHAQLQGEEEKLTLASQRLQAKVDAFRTRKETIKATYTAAEAQTRINEAFSGISEEMGDVGLAVQRAEDKTAADAGPSRRHRRADRLRRARRRQLDQPRRRHQPRAGVDELPGRRRGRARRAQGRAPRRPSTRPETPAQAAARRRAEPEDRRPRRGSSHDRPHPRRGAARGGRRPSSSALNELDAAVESAVEAGDTEAFTAALAALLDGVRRAGTPLAEDSLEDSDLILPPADATIDEVRELLSDDGLIPG